VHDSLQVCFKSLKTPGKGFLDLKTSIKWVLYCTATIDSCSVNVVTSARYLYRVTPHFYFRACESITVLEYLKQDQKIKNKKWGSCNYC
jgi:hypothetical protein